MNTPFLIIDTSGPDSFVALCSNDKLIAQHLPPLKQSQTLLPAIQKLLENQPIEFIAIGTGPGSFTGTRVGVMTGKTLAFAKKLPLLSFCSLMIYTPDQEGPFTIHTDARSEKLYTLTGIQSQKGVTYHEPPTLTSGNNPSVNILNLDCLAKYLLKKFLTTKSPYPQNLDICYLKLE